MNTYTRNSKTKYYSKIENLQFYKINRDFLKKNTINLLLDSSLIFQSNHTSYTHKIIQIGDYVQVYDYDKVSLRKDKNLEKDKNTYRIKCNKEQLYIDKKIIEEYDKFNNNPMYLEKSRGIPVEEFKHIDIPYKIKTKDNKKMIDIKNLNRAKFEMQRIIKANEYEFKTFITLTFEDNIKDIEYANKQFNSFRTYIKQLKSDFKYICVPEFQKRGAVHYHLLTNIDYTDIKLLSQNEIKLWSPKSHSWQIGKNIIGWNKGFTLAKDMKDINVVGYLSKYMTKDIDNRLWGKRKYLCSHNLIKPKVSYIDINNIEDFSKLVNITNNKDVLYNTEYKNIYDEKIRFIEYKSILES